MFGGDGHIKVIVNVPRSVTEKLSKVQSPKTKAIICENQRRLPQEVKFTKVDELRQELGKHEKNKIESKDGSKKELTEFCNLLNEGDWKEEKDISGEW